MKRNFVIFVIALIAVGGAYFGIEHLSKPLEVNNEETEPEIEIKEVPVPEIEVRIKEAQDLARAEIEKEAQEAYDDLYNLRMTEVENQVIDEVQAELDTRKASNTKKVQAY